MATGSRYNVLYINIYLFDDAYILCMYYVFFWCAGTSSNVFPTTDQGTRPIMVLCGLAVEAKAYCDPHTGVARMPTTDIAKRWHCGVQMRDSGATALPEARETCTRTTRQRRFLNLNHMATEHIMNNSNY